MLQAGEHNKMKNENERPLDLLNNSRGKEVKVKLQNEMAYRGTLVAFDIHINLILENVEEDFDNLDPSEEVKLLFIRGESVVSVAPIEKKAE